MSFHLDLLIEVCNNKKNKIAKGRDTSKRASDVETLTDGSGVKNFQHVYILVPFVYLR